jgi:hypothetical protein
MKEPRVLLCSLSVRTSQKGSEYLTGWLAKAKVIGWQGKPDKWENPTWDLYLVQPEDRPRPAEVAGLVDDVEAAF